MDGRESNSVDPANPEEQTHEASPKFVTGGRPPPRRSHTKSRRGCQDCKRRKVKCDEKYPSCFNCTRRGVKCSLATNDSGGKESESHQSPVSVNTSNHDTSAESAGDGSIGHILGGIHPENSIWPHGLELMHHYSNYTANTLALRADMQHTWRITIPEIAYTCPFLMHQILAVAALHKSSMLPSRREAFLDIATHHQACGLEGFRVAFSGVNNFNWKQFFCFSSLIALSACTLPPRELSAPQQSIPDVVQIFGFIQGIRTVLLPYQSKVKGTNLSSLMYGVWIIDDNDPCYEYPVMENSCLPASTFAAIRAARSFLQQNALVDKQDNYREAMTQLEKAAYLIAHAGSQPELGMVIYVPYVLPDPIIADIAQAHPCALIFLSYFSVLVKVLEPRFWFIQGWSRRLLAYVNSHLSEDSYFNEIMEWPRQQIFHIARLNS